MVILVGALATYWCVSCVVEEREGEIELRQARAGRHARQRAEARQREEERKKDKKLSERAKLTKGTKLKANQAAHK